MNCLAYYCLSFISLLIVKLPSLIYPQLAQETLHRLDWCLHRLESVNSAKSLGTMAQEKFQRMLIRELSSLSERRSGLAAAEWVMSMTPKGQGVFLSFLATHWCMNVPVQCTCTMVFLYIIQMSAYCCFCLKNMLGSTPLLACRMFRYFSFHFNFISTSPVLSRHIRTIISIGTSLSKPHHYVTVLVAFMYVCTYVCMVVIQYYILIQNYIKTF